MKYYAEVLGEIAAPIEARFKLDRHDGDALKAMREVVDCSFYDHNRDVRLQLIDEILKSKGV